jgi:hypothetical protein
MMCVARSVPLCPHPSIVRRPSTLFYNHRFGSKVSQRANLILAQHPHRRDRRGT